MFCEVSKMRFLHTGDWHIGKKLHGYDLLADQKAVIRQIFVLAKQEKVDAIVIAGDLYDRSVPSVEACEMLNQLFIEINWQEKIPVLAISGNHDSAVRLSTGMPWYELTDFHLYTKLEQSFDPIEIGDVQFYLLAYFEPVAARAYFHDDSLTLTTAIKKIIGQMGKSFDPGKKQVLVTHFFIAGSFKTDSETSVEVGGLNAISYDLLQTFDYVALGHLHSKNAIKKGNARYSGSPLKFSLSEKDDQKGIWIIDSSDLNPQFKALTPLRDVKELVASFRQLTDPDFYQQLNCEDFWQFQLTDRTVIPNMMNQLRAIYPNIIGAQRISRYRENVQLEKLKERKNSPQQMLQTFFAEITGDDLTKQQKYWLDQALLQATDTEKRG